MPYTGSTRILLNDFLDKLPNAKTSLINSVPYVYVDSKEVKLLAREVCFHQENNSAFALALAGDGILELLTFDE